jgi:hypothetical protein
LFVDVEITLVLTLVAYLMALGEYSPNGWTNSEGVLERLEHDVTTRRPVSVTTKRGKRKGVRSVVRKIESTFQRKTALLRIG